MIRLLSVRRGLWIGTAVTVCMSIIVWNQASLSTAVRAMRIKVFMSTSNVFGNLASFLVYDSSDMKSLKAVHTTIPLLVNMSALKFRVRNNKECLGVAADPRSYWRSKSCGPSLDTYKEDIARMGVALGCGMQYPEFFSQRVLPTFYPMEVFYLSEPPLVDITLASNENKSVVSAYNVSSEFKVGDVVAFKIEVRDGKGNPKLKGGDHIRAWFVDGSTQSRMTAKVTDFNNGTYMARAPLLFKGKLRLHVALAYSREYIRALLYSHQVFKSYRHIAAVFLNALASEATPCYHTAVVPGYTSSELCDLTEVNGSPWFCGRPVKVQLHCSDYNGTVVLYKSLNVQGTDAELELFARSCREPKIRQIPSNFEVRVLPGKQSVEAKLACNKVPAQNTWSQQIPTGYMSNNTWHFTFCDWTEPDYKTCFKNKQVLIFGDSNGRMHYVNVQASSSCTDVLKALTRNWHKPLLCVHKANNFSVFWGPHTNPFINGNQVSDINDLVPTSKAIDEIPSHGHYLIIMTHYYHLTSSHISATEFMFRSIKDALVRLFKRNPNVQVLLQSPHVAWRGWAEHYAAGDMLGPTMADMQREIFHEIRNKVVLFSPWDITIAVENIDYHPAINKDIYKMIFGFMCGR